jgi:hypothetical protein
MLAEELSELDFEEEEKITDVESFYKELEYKTAKVNSINFENISESIMSIFSNDSAVSVFFKNLAKTQPIIFNENKEVAFVDQFNVYFAISKMFGLDSKKYIIVNKKSMLSVNMYWERVFIINDNKNFGFSVYLGWMLGVSKEKYNIPDKKAINFGGLIFNYSYKKYTFSILTEGYARGSESINFGITYKL